MREILFRGKTADSGEWVEGYVIKIGSKIRILTVGMMLSVRDDSPRSAWAEPVLYDVNPETVGQFTGLCDSHGKNIFEGDILAYDNMKYLVEYEFGAFRLYEVGGEYVLSNLDAECATVVGNIHDNEGLLDV